MAEAVRRRPRARHRVRHREGQLRRHRGGSQSRGERFKVERLIVAFECGAIVNPDGLNNQVEGSVIQGLGGALFEAIEFGDGAIVNGTMAQYRVPRFKDIPPIEILLLDRKDLGGGGRARRGGSGGGRGGGEAVRRGWGEGRA